MSNIQGGGALINGVTYELRSVLDEIVQGYPSVAHHKKIYERELDIKDPNTRTTEILFEKGHPDEGCETEFER